VELTSPITANTTLKDLGRAVDYVYKANGLLRVENNATLTIEPGVTIQFTHTSKGGGLQVRGGATVKASGTAEKRIRFLGPTDESGSWVGIRIETTTDNRFDYCDFVNMGNSNNSSTGGFWINGKVGFTHCKLSNGVGNGIYFHYDPQNISQLSVFTNNVIEGYGTPVSNSSRNAVKILEKFDMTSDLTNNRNKYIGVRDATMEESVTINRTTVPYYFSHGALHLETYTLTINEGVTIYMAERNVISGNSGRLMINGTASNKVRFTRLPDGGAYFWNRIAFGAPGSIIKHCIFEYGGGGSQYVGALEIWSTANLTLENVAVNNAKYYGVYFHDNSGWTVNHSNVTFSGNGLGNVHLRSNVQSTLP
jgi:hypothetical protein